MYKTNKISQIELDILAQFPGLICVMNRDSELVYANEYTARLFGYENADAALGIKADAMRCQAAESAQEFQEQDQFVLTTNDNINILDIHTYAQNQPKILLTKKKPFIQHNQIVGVLCYCTEINSEAFSKICHSIMSADKTYYPKKQVGERSYTIGTIQQNSELTSREKDCLFYLIRGKTQKEIARILDISPRTVETHKTNIKMKWQCQSYSEVIEVAIMKGFLNYLPKNIVEREISSVIN